jgi:hypothetical protein
MGTMGVRSVGEVVVVVVVVVEEEVVVVVVVMTIRGAVTLGARRVGAPDKVVFVELEEVEVMG